MFQVTPNCSNDIIYKCRFNKTGLLEACFVTQFYCLGPANHVPPTAHRPHTYIHPHHQPPMFPSDYNPMMESPPNANALEVPQHQILNLSQPPPISNAGARAGPPPPILAPSHPAPASNFPPDIATILNEPRSRPNILFPLIKSYKILLHMSIFCLRLL